MYWIKNNSNFEVHLKETILSCIPKSFRSITLSSGAVDQENSANWNGKGVVTYE